MLRPLSAATAASKSFTATTPEPERRAVGKLVLRAAIFGIDTSGLESEYVAIERYRARSIFDHVTAEVQAADRERPKRTRQLIEYRGPAVLVDIALLRIAEELVRKNQLGLWAARKELHRQQRLRFGFLRFCEIRAEAVKRTVPKAPLIDVRSFFALRPSTSLATLASLRMTPFASCAQDDNSLTPSVLSLPKDTQS
jgi:hypothetical protein